MMEATGHDRSFILPLLLACATATMVARSVWQNTEITRTIEPRSICDARLTDEEVEARQRASERPAQLVGSC
jgi:H+/Cl- antiporter ClcA